MKKLTDRTFGSLTVHADGGYSWKGKRIPPRCCDVIDACLLLGCYPWSAATYAADFLKLSGIESSKRFEFSIAKEAAEYVRANWVWVNE